MSTPINDDGTTDDTELGDESASLAPPTIESYETDDGVVFYDAENPLAWMETAEPISLADLA